jgi:hypothetical protein
MMPLMGMLIGSCALYHTWEISKQSAIAYRKPSWNVIAVFLKARPALSGRAGELSLNRRNPMVNLIRRIIMAISAAKQAFLDALAGVKQKISDFR